MKSPMKIATLCFLFLAAALPMAAQSEVDPDHFPDEPSQVVPAPQTELQVQVHALQAQLEGYEAQITAKSEMVEQTRLEAVSAGIQGDGAGSYIDEYRMQQKQLESLQQSLAPRIVLARNAMASLQAQGLVAALARVGEKRTAMTKKRSPAPVLMSSWMSLRRPDTHR